MKVALVDNMNNNFFALARYLRELDLDVDLFLVDRDGQAHFHPENDTFLDLRNEKWIKPFPFDYSVRDMLKSKTSLKRIFRPYDKIIACGNSMAYFEKVSIQVDLYIPYGSDLYALPFFNQKIELFSLKSIVAWFVQRKNSKLQCKSIKRAKSIICNTNWSTTQLALEKIGREAINLPRLMIYKEKATASEGVDLWKFIEEHDFVVISPTRHLWKSNGDALPDFEKYGGMKRNDKLLTAFSRCIKQNLFNNPKLILFQYGLDVEFSKTLINDLGIENYVQWMPLMPRKEIMRGMSRASFVADQFRENMSATSAGTTNEALAVGTPVITNTDGALNDISDPYYGAPILQALEVDEIFEYFEEYAQNRQKYKGIGKSGSEWFDNHLGRGLAQRYLSLLSSL